MTAFLDRFYEAQTKQVAFLAISLKLEQAKCLQLLLKGILRDTGSANGRINTTVSAHVLRWGYSGRIDMPNVMNHQWSNMLRQTTKQQ